MWKGACDTAERLIAEAKEYNKLRYDKTHKKPEFREGDQVLVSTCNLNNLKVPEKQRDSFVAPLTIIRVIGKNTVEVRITEEFSRKNPVLSVRQVKYYHQAREGMFHSRNKSHNLQD
ncbi:hypothetical protein O181_033565 [Austropuccinia psidii MF-1]|uniref:Uncharacterized protein n=1 Tax=Austropuccinia psidii MF-1 TaxID=1389203 RepID=A0A9Q3D3A5_9BASI|nr:hypothetical protein [Austropuccinia psidii MF-1]